MEPRISVIMSVWNAASTVGAAVESVLEQTFGDFEFLVVDDGSTDATPEVLAGFSDPRLRVIRQENAGLTVSLNRAVSMAGARLIARMDADDVSRPDRLENQVRFLDRFPDAVLLGTDAGMIDTEGENSERVSHLLADADIRAVYPVGNQFVHGSTMFRKEAFDRAGRYNEAYRFSQDYDLWWRLMKVGSVYNLPDVLYLLRESEERISSRLKGKQRKDVYRMLRGVWGEILEDPSLLHAHVQPGNPAAEFLRNADTARKHRISFHARLLLRMGVGFVLNQRIDTARDYFLRSARQRPTEISAWGCLILARLTPRFLTAKCIQRSGQFPLYRTIWLRNRIGPGFPRARE